MGKHKRSRSRGRDYNDILRELKKITSRKRRRSSSPSSSESDKSLKHKRYYDYDEDIGYGDNYNVEYQGELSPGTYPYQNPEAKILETVEPGPSSSATGEAAALDEANAPTAGPAPTTSPDNPEETVPSLEPELLELLGENPNDNKKGGENLHKDIAPRWTHILINGLSKDTQLELVKRYLPPENCPNMKVPMLNLEVKAALLEINIKKDLYSQSKQNQLSSSLAAIGQVLNWALSSKDVVPPNIIQTLSDAGRLICDSHYRESLSRRYAALNTLNKNIRDTIKNTGIDEHLFGSDLSEHIKASKAIIKTGSEMKSTAARPAYRPQTYHQQRGL